MSVQTDNTFIQL